jgi:hypothetical protein
MVVILVLVVWTRNAIELSEIKVVVHERGLLCSAWYWNSLLVLKWRFVAAVDQSNKGDQHTFPAKSGEL